MISFYGADADFRAGKVLQNGDRLAKPALELANLSNDAPMEGIVAVAEIEPRHVHAGADESFENSVGHARRSDGADDLSPAHFFNLHEFDGESINASQS